MAIIQGVIDAITGIAPTMRIGSGNQAARVEVRPWDMQPTMGAYRVAGRSGAITGAAVIAAAPLFAFRWAGGGTSTGFAIITRIKAGLDVTTIFTAAQEIGLEAVRATSWTSADSAGTSLLPAASENKLRTTMPASGVSSMRIAATTLLTAGTRTLDQNAFSISNLVGERVVNAAAATAYLPGPPQAVLDFFPGDYGSPLILASGEGFIIRNLVAFPAAGAVTMWVEIAWVESPTWP